MIYLDSNATTPTDPAVVAALQPYLTTLFGNPSSIHRFGQQSRQAIEHARHQLADLLGCSPRELTFTSGGTEADNAAILGLLRSRAPRRTIITSSVEHSAVREPLKDLATQGYRVITIPVHPGGQLDMPALAAALADPDAALATIMWANNETGVIFDIGAIGTLTQQYRVPLHVDAVQAVGKIPFTLRDLPIDLLSLSAHKFHGPKGTGALYIRRSVHWSPQIRGGPQERERRGGTENVASIVGMGIAAELAAQHLIDGTPERIAALRDRFEQTIHTKIPESQVIGDRTHRLPNTTNIAFAGLEAEAILLLLSEHDVCASAGAACSSGSLEPSPVLRAMHLPDRILHGAIRFSLSRFTTEEEIDQALQIIPPIITRLLAVMPVA
jgi:cysteine desulfurase